MRALCLRLLTLALAGAAMPAGAEQPATAPAYNDPGAREGFFDPRRPLAAEARMTIADGFTLAVAGDLIITRPLSQAAKPKGFDALIGVIGGSDAAFGNLETPLLDIRYFKGAPFPFEGDWANLGEPAVAADLKAMGFDLVGRANNHVLDWGVEGMRETSGLLDAQGLAFAGVGEDAALARAPRYLETPKGRVALVSFATTFRPTSEAMPPRGQAPGRPGLSALHLTRTVHVTAAAMDALARADCALNKLNCEGAPDALTFEGVSYRRDTRAYDDYAIDPEDRAEIGRAIREARQHADLVIVAIHAHQCARNCGDTSAPQVPAEILKTIAHDAIDAGGDVFAASGIHNLGPIEIYRERPIFYGLGNFFWSDIIEPVPHELFQINRTMMEQGYAHPERATDYDLTAPLNATSFNNDFTFQSVLAQLRFAGGRLAEIRLNPVWLGYGETLRTSGTPRLESDPARAKAIFDAIAERTRAYGLPPLRMRIEKGIAIVTP